MRGDRVIPRWRDERVLEALSLKQRGFAWAKIAALTGFGSGNAVQRACPEVRADDAAESTDEEVAGCYW